MQLHIYLKNNKKHIDEIKASLRNSDSFAFVENDEIIIENNTIIKEYIDLSREGFSNAQSLVKNHLNSINGLAKLYSTPLPFLKTKLILFKHDNGTWLPVPIGASINATFMLGSPPSISEHVKASSTNKHFAKATRLYAQESSMANLYKIFELMRETGYKFPKKQLNSFKMSANREKISGDDARHGEFTFKGELPKKTMDINDANSFIAKHMRIWLKTSHR